MKKNKAEKGALENENETHLENEKVPEPKIIFEDDNYLVIDKPAGLAVHPGGNIKGATLKDWLVNYLPEIISIGESEERPGIVHRLDMDVSGLMVLAKTKEAYDDLKKQFKARRVTKEYVALVYGDISKDSDVIDFPIKRSREGFKMAAMPRNNENILTRKHPKNRDQGNLDALEVAKDSITEFSIIKRFVNYNLIDIKIKTGRTHQIRVHLYAYGHPLVGDPLYFTKKTKVKNQKFGLGRVFLFSKKLAFKNLEKEKLVFEIKMPKELEKKLPRN